MKKIIALLAALVLLTVALPSFAKVPVTKTARTNLLDLRNTTTASFSVREGWSFDPTGNDGDPKLTLTNYGSASQHSAPVVVPTNTTVVVNGDCYIDNALMNGPYFVLSGSGDGYLHIEGSGSLNLYADQYNGRCISLPAEGENLQTGELCISDITVNCYGLERTNHNAATLEPCIFGSRDIRISNAVINTVFGSCGIKSNGQTPIGGVTEETANVILIEDSVVNIQNNSDNGLWNFAMGIWTTFGKIRITGDSDVTINAGSNSIYSYLSFTIEGGRVNILSTPVSTYVGAAIVNCGKLCITDDIESVYFGTVKYPLTTVLYARQDGNSTAGSGLTFLIGGFADGNYFTGPDSSNKDLPALKIAGSDTVVHTVSFYGFDGSLITTVNVPDGQPVEPPAVEKIQNNSNGTYVFYGWDRELDSVTEDMDVHALYTLFGDVDFDGSVTSADALLIIRHTMELTTLSPRQIAAGEVTLDGNLDSSDALLIIRYVMELIPSLL